MLKDAQMYKQIGLYEQKVDVYDGDNCEQHKPQWWGFMDGDDGPELGIEDPLEFSLECFPPGTKIVVSVPMCPECELDRACAYDDGVCVCGYDWKNWDEAEYS